MQIKLENLYLHYFFDFDSVWMKKHVMTLISKSVVPLVNMPLYIPGIQRGLETGIKAHFNTNGSTMIDKPSPFFQKLVAYMTVPTLLGDEFHGNTSLIKSFSEFTHDILKNILFLNLIPNTLHPWISSYLQSADHHRRVLSEQVVPVVHQRREKIRQAKEAGIDHGLENNYLNNLIQFVLDTDENNNPVYHTDADIVDSIL
jgi:hypothetical protein